MPFLKWNLEIVYIVVVLLWGFFSFFFFFGGGGVGGFGSCCFLFLCLFGCLFDIYYCYFV